MVRVVAAQVVHVDRDLGVIDKPLEKLVHQVDIELADHRALESDLPDQSGAARKIEHHSAQRLVQRHVGMTEAADAALVADRLGHGLRSEEHTSELQSQSNLVCRLLLEKKKDSYREPLAYGLTSVRPADV